MSHGALTQPAEQQYRLACSNPPSGGGQGVAQHTRSYVRLRLSRPTRSFSYTPAAAPAWSPVHPTGQLLTNFAISRAYRSPRGHGGVAERDRDGVVAAQELLGHLCRCVWACIGRVRRTSDARTCVSGETRKWLKFNANAVMKKASQLYLDVGVAS